MIGTEPALNYSRISRSISLKSKKYVQIEGRQYVGITSIYNVRSIHVWQ